MVKKGLVIIHRKPPPPLQTFEESIQADANNASQSPSSSSFPQVSLPSSSSILSRRAYLSSNTYLSNGQKPLSSHSQTNTATNGQISNQPSSTFSLFDYLQELALTESEFEEKLKEEGYILNRVKGDGNCMFRSIADQIFGDEELHAEVRKLTLDYMEKESDFFRNYVTIDYKAYIEHKRKNTVFGDHLELQAMTELFNRPVEIRIPGKDSIIIGYYDKDGTSDSSSNATPSMNETYPPLRISYHNQNHYNSIRDPRVHKLGIGLGLATPLISETQQMEEAVSQSVQSDVEKQLLEQAKLDSEQDLINDQLIAEAAMHESEIAALDDRMLYEMQYGSMPDQGAYGDDLADDYDENDENDELNEAIRLSLLESQPPTDQ